MAEVMDTELEAKVTFKTKKGTRVFMLRACDEDALAIRIRLLKSRIWHDLPFNDLLDRGLGEEIK